MKLASMGIERASDDNRDYSFLPKEIGELFGVVENIVYLCKQQTKMMMNAGNKYIRFDWAVKRMLRDKANFGVLEGLITVLLNEPVHIVELLESEGNQDTADDKFNRVDIRAKNDRG